ncbi:alginate export family protein [Brevundimonas sp. GCM10030266]|uniref:alginate export family protein n=1 Tax=Brevundimonas sp. GCM10030266 TaxID=3273386 RepID=UPI00361A408F
MLLNSAAAAALILAASPEAPAADAPIITAPPAVQAAPAAAPAARPAPAFRPINHDEDWSAYRTVGDDASGWAQMKAIPVGSTWLSLGGEARWRAEYRGHERFGRGLQDDDGNLQQRLRLWADWRLTPNLRAFVDIQDARTHGLDSGEPFTEESRADVHQAFLETKHSLGDGAVRVRVGRQEFAVGASRIFEPREGANARTAFDMARVIYDNPTGWSGGLFGGYAIRESKASFDDATNYDYRLYGATAARTLGTGPTASRLEFLYANTDRIGVAFDTGLAGRDDRDTFSARLNGRVAPWDYDVEGVLQTGDFRGLDIEAWYVSATVGRTFDHAWKPRVAVRFDAASGDDDRNDGTLGTYNQLYVPPISLRTDLGVSNLVTIQPQVTFQPLPKTTVGLVTAGLWRQSKEDGVYLLSGQLLRSGTEGDSAYVGWRYAAFTTYQVSPFVTVSGVVNYTRAGDFLEESGAKDQSYAGLIVGLKF